MLLVLLSALSCLLTDVMVCVVDVACCSILMLMLGEVDGADEVEEEEEEEEEE